MRCFCSLEHCDHASVNLVCYSGFLLGLDGFEFLLASLPTNLIAHIRARVFDRFVMSSGNIYHLRGIKFPITLSLILGLILLRNMLLAKGIFFSENCFLFHR